MRRTTVPRSAEIQASIDELLSKGMVDDPQKMLSELARQVIDEVDLGEERPRRAPRWDPRGVVARQLQGEIASPRDAIHVPAPKAKRDPQVGHVGRVLIGDSLQLG